MDGDKDFTRIRTLADLDSQRFEPATVWRPGEGGYRGLDVFGGLRYVDLDPKVRFDQVNPLFWSSERNFDTSHSDFMLGASYTWALSDPWGLTLRGDGPFGASKGSASASSCT